MVGSRNASWHGRAFASQLASQLSALGFVIVSGLARGIDAVCHEGALSVGGKTIAVLGHGFDLVYPKQNSDLFARIASEGLLISEYEDGTSPRPYLFLRVIEWLLDCVTP
jgi:DNA processing protein